MIEKLVEDWLDSASERSYQPVFVQILAGMGHKVLHSTRHCALEYGKDVITIAPDGVPCAYQLKGNPGGRLGLKAFKAEILDQLVQLISKPIIYPGVSIGKVHRSYLVSNGYFDEEVHRAVDDLNRGGYRSKVELISRGDLSTWAKEHGTSLWPSELSSVRDMLEIFLHDGRDLLPLNRLAKILQGVFGLDYENKPLTKRQVKRASPSAALLTGIVTYHFSEVGNHVATISAWCLFSVSLIASCERSRVKFDKKLVQQLNIAQDAIKDGLVALWNEVDSREHMTEGDVMADVDLRSWRCTLLRGLFSNLWLFPGDSQEDLERRENIGKWLASEQGDFALWGEGAVPQFVAYLFFLRRYDSTLKSDLEMASLLQLVVDSNQDGSRNPLPDPYYRFEHIVGSPLNYKPSGEWFDIKEDNFSGTSYTAELLLHLVTRSMLKYPCRNCWPDFSKLGHLRFITKEPWHYGLVRNKEGSVETRYYPREYTWEELRNDAAKDDDEGLPLELTRRPHLLLLWTILVPQRLTTQVVKAVDKIPHW